MSDQINGHRLKDERSLSQHAMRKLVGIAANDDSRELRWSTSDFAALWLHHLDSPIIAELGSVDGIAALRASEQIAAHAAPAPQTFRDLLHHPSPSIALLQIGEQLVSQRLGDPDPIVPRDVSLALHLIFCFAIRARCGSDAGLRHLSAAIADTELRRRGEWLLRQMWIDGTSRSVVEQTIAEFDVSDFPT